MGVIGNFVANTVLSVQGRINGVVKPSNSPNTFHGRQFPKNGEFLKMF